MTNLRISSLNTYKKSIKKVKGEHITKFLVKNFEEVKHVLAKNYKIDFRDKIKSLRKVIRAVVRSSSLPEHNLNSFFQLFAVDFMIDTKGDIYLLEFNAFPNFVPDSKKKKAIYQPMLEDVFKSVRRKVWRTRKRLRKVIDEGIGLDEKVAVASYEVEDL